MIQAQWANTYGPDATGPWAGKSYWICTKEWANQANSYPWSVPLYSNMGGFASGGVPNFGVIGKDNVVYYNDAGYAESAIMQAIQNAIDSFNPENIVVDNPIENVDLDINQSTNIDLSDVFSVESGATITLSVDDNTDPTAVETSLSGNTLTLNAIGGGVAQITIKAETASDEEYDTFTVIVTDPNATSYWTGIINAVNNSGLGLSGGGAWSLGIALDFGNDDHKIKTISYMCNSGTTAPVEWRVLEMSDMETWTDTELITTQNLTNNPQPTEEWVDVVVNNDTEISGNVGLVVDLPAGGYWGRDETNTTGISYLYYQDAWHKLGTGVVGSFPGDWCLKAFVEKTNGSGIEAEMIPGSTTLAQNYPNPFNPSTTISFLNTMSGQVNLTVFNSNGEMVQELVDAQMSTGNHSVTFDASTLNAGVYFYTLTTPNASITKKMILVK